MHARGDESTVDVAVVPSKPSHQGEQFSYLVGVLGVNARYGLVAALRPLAAYPWPVEMVVVEAHACREAVMLIEVGLEHQRCITVSLIGVVLLMSVQGILVVCGTREDKSDVRRMFRVEDIGIFHECLITLVGDVDEVWMARRGMVPDLPTFPMLLHSLH